MDIDERQALITFFNETGGDEWRRKGSWCTDAPLGEWYGVKTNNEGSVVQLNLSDNNLIGVIPLEIKALKNLEVLDLSGNKLRGAIPPELGKMQNLRILNLFSNQLSGTIPVEICQAKSLDEIILINNQLSGGIPPELGKMQNLRILVLCSNQLSSAIPPELGKMQNLRILYLSRNQLSGGIPPELGKMQHLSDFDVSRNQLSGTIPAEISYAKSLECINLSYNQLSGAIPPELGKMLNLRILVLSSNQLSGTIPAEISHAKSLKSIHLSNNQLSGAIPPELGRMQHLSEIFLSSNQLSGAIPLELGKMQNLRMLYLDSNQLSGSIPPELGEMLNLRILVLSSNQLSGAIPPELGKLQYLSDLDLSSNQLSGAIPPELGEMLNSRDLNLSSNQLSGAIPPQLGKMRHLFTLNLSSNQLSGGIPPELGEMLNLRNLNLSSNQLSGAIPPELGKPYFLSNVNLSSNQLSGGGMDVKPQSKESEGIEDAKSKDFPEQEPKSAWRFLGNIFQGHRNDLKPRDFKAKPATAEAVGKTLPELEPLPWKCDAIEGVKPSGHQPTKLDFLQERPQSPVHDLEGETEDKSKEHGLPKDVNKQRHDEESNTLEYRKGTFLAERLGTQAATFSDFSLGVKFILEDGSLKNEIKKDVIVKREVRYVTCSSRDRDTSRTHQELLAHTSDDGIEEPVTLLAMPVVCGPSEAIFDPHRPAKLRYFAGYSEDIKQDIEDQGGDGYSGDAIEGYLRDMYEPLISADGKDWRMLPPFNVQFKASQTKGEEIWLETPIYHFSEGAIGQVISKKSKTNKLRFLHEDMSRYMKWKNKDSVLFGNATGEELMFYACKLEATTSTDRRRALGVGAPYIELSAEAQDAVSITDRGTHTVDYHVKAGTFLTAEMPRGGNWVQEQVLIGVFMVENLPEQSPPGWRTLLLGSGQSRRSQYFLWKAHLSKGKMFVVLPDMISDWRNRSAKKKIDSDADIPTVREFIFNTICYV